MPLNIESLLRFPVTGFPQQNLAETTDASVTGTTDVKTTDVKTAESHRTRIMKKLGIKETAGLVRYALRQGVTQL